MLRIRFARVGKKGYPTYRIVVAEHSKPVGGQFVARLGSYDPHSKATTLDKKAAVEWMKQGAKPSNTVAKILDKEGVRHPAIAIKTFRAISKQELEAQGAAAEAERQKRKAEQEAQKEAWEKESETRVQAAVEEKAAAAATEGEGSAQEKAAVLETAASPNQSVKKDQPEQPQPSVGNGQPAQGVESQEKPTA